MEDYIDFFKQELCVLERKLKVHNIPVSDRVLLGLEAATEIIRIQHEAIKRVAKGDIEDFDFQFYLVGAITKCRQITEKHLK